MSAYSTLNITRSKAKDIYLNHFLGKISNEEIESFFDEILEDNLYNVRIVPDNSQNDDYLIERYYREFVLDGHRRI